MTWFQIWTVCWQVAIVVTPLIVALCMLWLRSQFVTKIEHASEHARVDGKFNAIAARMDTEKVERDQRYDSLKDRAGGCEARLSVLESDNKNPPSRHELNNAVQSAMGGVHSLGKSLDQMRGQIESRDAALQRQMETLSGYLHTIIEKHLA